MTTSTNERPPALPGSAKVRREQSKSPTATASPRPSSTAVSGADDGTRPMVNAVSQEADELDYALVESVENGEKLTAKANEILERCGKDFIRTHAKMFQLSRIRRVLESQEIAGTKADREAIRELISAAEEVAARRVPEIDEQIRKLQIERECLIKAVDEPTAKLKEMERSVEQLREKRNISPILIGELERLSRNHRKYSSALEKAENAVRRCDEMLESIDRGAEIVADHARMCHRTVTAELIEELTVRRNKAKQDAEELRRIFNAIQADRESILNRYVV